MNRLRIAVGRGAKGRGRSGWLAGSTAREELRESVRVQGKSFEIPKQLIWAAWLKVRQNGGAAGADGVVLPERGDPDRQAPRSPSDALGTVEVQTTQTQRRPRAGMASGSPETATRPVRALDTAVHDLTPERHEPDKSRGLRPDLWGPGGEIPPGYPALRSA